MSFDMADLVCNFQSLLVNQCEGVYTRSQVVVRTRITVSLVEVYDE